ncbi:MAG: SDR family NAD(P)-dependent oxidoreductase [Sporocytophaga sp.]|nr:SDR family NAD(P)-dependent oxidoreductase [Sporocytophaga sp.]
MAIEKMQKGDIVLITGGSSGVGLQLAKELTHRGCKVLICGRTLEKLQQVQKEIPGIDIFQCDLSKIKDCNDLCNHVIANYPGLNILINNAAIVNKIDFRTDESALPKAVEEFNINIMAPIRLTKALLPVVERNMRPQIINISTGLIYAPREIYPYYNATKAALHSFTQVLRMQLRKSSPVKITEVLLPVVDTPWHQGNPPKMAIPVNKAVSEMLLKLGKGQTEIRVGKVELLYWLSRIAPQFAIRMLNRATSRK